MEGFSEIIYKNKAIFYTNFSIYKADPDYKQKILDLLKFSDTESLKKPLNSVLALVNISNVKYDMNILHHFKESMNKTAPYGKKLAVLGVNGLLKSGYNFVVGLTPNLKRKAFDTEQEALEWLVMEE